MTKKKETAPKEAKVKAAPKAKAVPTPKAAPKPRKKRVKTVVEVVASEPTRRDLVQASMNERNVALDNQTERFFERVRTEDATL